MSDYAPGARTVMDEDEFEDYDREVELALYREYRDVVGQFKFVVETERRFYLANEVELVRQDTEHDFYFELTMNDVWVWDVYRSDRFVKSVRVLTFKDVNVEELEFQGAGAPEGTRTGRMTHAKRRWRWPDARRGPLGIAAVLLVTGCATGPQVPPGISDEEAARLMLVTMRYEVAELQGRVPECLGAFERGRGARRELGGLGEAPGLCLTSAGFGPVSITKTELDGRRRGRPGAGGVSALRLPLPARSAAARCAVLGAGGVRAGTTGTRRLIPCVEAPRLPGSRGAAAQRVRRATRWAGSDRCRGRRTSRCACSPTRRRRRSTRRARRCRRIRTGCSHQPGCPTHDRAARGLSSGGRCDDWGYGRVNRNPPAPGPGSRCSCRPSSGGRPVRRLRERVAHADHVRARLRQHQAAGASDPGWPGAERAGGAGRLEGADPVGADLPAHPRADRAGQPLAAGDRAPERGWWLGVGASGQLVELRSSSPSQGVASGVCARMS